MWKVRVGRVVCVCVCMPQGCVCVCMQQFVGLRASLVVLSLLAPCLSSLSPVSPSPRALALALA